LFANIIYTSILVLFLGLLYRNDSLDSDVQTVRPSLAGPVSYVLDGVILAGCLFPFAIGFFGIRCSL